MKTVLRSALLLTLAAGCGRHPEPAAAPADPRPPAPVRVEKAVKVRIPRTEETVGTVRAVKRALVESRLSGVILELPVTQGQMLKAGDLVASLDVRDVQSRLDQARAQLDQAKRDLERATSLLAQNALPRQEFDAAEARERVARALVTGAETQLGFGRLTAPFDGVVTRKLAEQGDLAAPGRPVVEIEDPARLRLETDVPEALALALATGQAVPVRIPSLERAVDATVAEISPVADPVSRTVRVKLDLPGLSGLRPGLFGRAAIPAGESESIAVPSPALVRRGQLEMVFVSGGGRAVLRLVRAGAERDGRVEILSGLADGEPVVTEGADRLTDGRMLEVRP